MWRACGCCLLVSIVGCGLVAPDGSAVSSGEVTMLVRDGGSGDSPAALLGGTLDVIEGCVALATDGTPVFLLFPAGSDLIVDHDGSFEIDVDGHILRQGSQVELGGGLVGRRKAMEVTNGEVPRDCRVSGESYGWVGDVVTP